MWPILDTVRWIVFINAFHGNSFTICLVIMSIPGVFFLWTFAVLSFSTSARVTNGIFIPSCPLTWDNDSVSSGEVDWIIFLSSYLLFRFEVFAWLVFSGFWYFLFRLESLVSFRRNSLLSFVNCLIVFSQLEWWSMTRFFMRSWKSTLSPCRHQSQQLRGTEITNYRTLYLLLELKYI